MKKLLLAIVLISSTIQSQTYVKGTLEPAQDFSWVILYQLKGAKQLYVKNVTIENGEFLIDFPENSEKGMYRLMYSQQNGGYVDFIYSKKSVELKFNPENPFETVSFINSEENKTYKKYLIESEIKQQKLDSLQFVFFNVKDEKNKKELAENYKIARANFNEFQKKYELATEANLSNHFIKSRNKYYAPSLIKTQQEYLNSIKLHYFDFINFKDKELLNSTFLSEKIVEYVFYLNGSEDVEVQNKLYKNAIQEVFSKVEDVYLKSELITTLLYSFSQIENSTLIDFLTDNFYNKLPEEVKNKTIIDKVQEKVKLAIGKTAPEISWKENNIEKKLLELDIAEKYIIVFWSSDCSHCLTEMPLLYEYTKDKTNIHVIAVALEKDEVGFNYYTPNYEKWTNILGLHKWENSISREYQINATPSYFVLDSTKKIIAKPDYFEDVKVFFEK
ncbi:TlpA family protein disulfide reductase [Lutibacter sp.]